MIVWCFLARKSVLCDESIVFWHLYLDCGDYLDGIKHLINTPPNLVESNNPLKLLVNFVGEEADENMCFYPAFCKMGHCSHFVHFVNTYSDREAQAPLSKPAKLGLQVLSISLSNRTPL